MERRFLAEPHLLMEIQILPWQVHVCVQARLRLFVVKHQPTGSAATSPGGLTYHSSTIRCIDPFAVVASAYHAQNIVINPNLYRRSYKFHMDFPDSFQLQPQYFLYLHVFTHSYRLRGLALFCASTSSTSTTAIY